MKNIHVGQDITLVSKGIRHGYGSSYVDSLLVGETSFMRVIRVGTKYVYGHYVYFEDGQRKEHDHESKFDVDDHIILDGIRQEYHTAYLRYRQACNDYEKAQQEARRDFEREAYDLVRAKSDEWEKANPRPKPIDLTEITKAETRPEANQTTL